MSLVSLRIPYCWGMIMMLDLLNKIASMEFPRIQKQNEKLVRKYMAESRATPMDQQDLAEEIGIDDGYLSSIISPSKRTRKYRKIIKGRDVLRFASRGVYKMRELGLNVNDEFENELLRLGLLIEKSSLIQTLFRCFDEGIDPEDYLKPVLAAIEGRKKDSSKIIEPENDESEN